VDEKALQAMSDRLQVEDVILRYASSIDFKDYPTLRGTLADDVVAQYGPAEPIKGGDTLAAWIEEMGEDRLWQHHLLNVYHVDVDGDEARALVYHTSHSASVTEPDDVLVIVARYKDTLRRIDGSWRIADKRMELCWMETRHFSQSEASEAEKIQAKAARERAESA
jgi:hypothetical protein